ncbi:aldehyde dehydrogenase [Rhizodiscina lignyota]|uniref:Aldehyde dehydrogenase n=1 Tax=Rhizodiscina lignyota TaxID=1504668 RepID=A0A9P4M2G1_9PEZI|nr:aldehyde dehydrogenase [Rhizodiscina lignyota]
MVQLPTFEHTPMEGVETAYKTVYDKFHTHTTKPIEWRLKQLRKLYWGMRDNMDLINAACLKDLGKPVHETYLSEVGWCMNDIIFVCKNLAKWVKDESAPDIDLLNKIVSPTIRKDPMGVVLIIGAYNFPFQLSIGPLIGAIAAGCTVVLKPSENAPAAGAVIEKIFKESLDPSAYQCVQGGVPETTSLLNNKWDLIFYTGNAAVGTIIAKKAAETLTPIVLELGGRNPAIITKNANVRLAARRLYWAKVHNAGQVCVSQNYILIDKEKLAEFLQELKNTIAEFYPDGVKNSKDYARIVNNRQWQRLKKMLDESKGKILLGGTMDEADRFLEPTVVQVDDPTDSLLVDESFGPLIPIYPVNDLDEAIRLANKVSDTSLGIYPFGNKKETARVLNETRSGGASINDGFFHASIPTLAFGGVGQSGTGSYRGKASFDAFTHRRSFTKTPGWMESLLAIRYPPYTGKTKQFRQMNEQKPTFDRDGNVYFTSRLKAWLFGTNTLVVVLLAVGIQQYMQRRSKL